MRTKLLAVLTLLLLFAGITARAQQGDIPPEDQEIIELLEILENMELFKEDPDMIKDIGAAGGNHAN